jgi:hypothetical protein
MLPEKLLLNRRSHDLQLKVSLDYIRPDVRQKRWDQLISAGDWNRTDQTRDGRDVTRSE